MLPVWATFLLFSAGVVALGTSPLWFPQTWARLPPIRRTPLTHAWEVMVSSIEHSPDEWRLDRYYAFHPRTKTNLWIANGFNFLKVEQGALQGVSMPWHYRRRFLKAVLQMRVIAQQEQFLKAWEPRA
jgi:hypothetical protein